MGKKRSKTAKQLQNKAAKKLAQSFAKKLGVSAESQRTAAAMISPSKPAVAKKKQTTKTARKAEKKKQIQKTNPSKVKLSTEAREFAQAQASVQEREQVVEWKRNNTGKKNNNARRRQAKPSKATALGFAAPTFCFLPHQKSTQQLIQETTQQVQTTNVFGATSMATNMMITESSSLPRWDGSSKHNNNNNTTTTSNNPFAVLQQEEEEQPAQPAAPTLFSFAPPSFSLATTSTAVDTDYDPDL